MVRYIALHPSKTLAVVWVLNTKYQDVTDLKLRGDGRVMAFSSHARILGECSTVHSRLFFLKWRLARAY